MEKLNRAERWVLFATVLFLVFLSGYFLGRNHTAGSIEVQAGTASSIGELSAEVSLSEPEPQIPAVPENPAVSDTGSEKVNLNTASATELMELPGIGEVLANRDVYKRQTEAKLAIDGCVGNNIVCRPRCLDSICTPPISFGVVCDKREKISQKKRRTRNSVRLFSKNLQFQLCFMAVSMAIAS